jgi:hypothetical protein
MHKSWCWEWIRNRSLVYGGERFKGELWAVVPEFLEEGYKSAEKTSIM